jgi:hypothetical protein
MARGAPDVVAPARGDQLRGLRRWNGAMGVLHLVQGAAMLAVASAFSLPVTSSFLRWLMELHNQTTERTNWTAFWFGSFAGAVPWVAVAIYLAGAASPPGFVYGIFASLFVFFNVFAVNMLLQYKRVGRWRDYLYGERVYMLLSLTAKSALAWQVFGGTLQPA